MSEQDPSRNDKRWYVEVRVLSASESEGILKVEKVHSSHEEAKESFAQRQDKIGLAVFPAAFWIRPEEGDRHKFNLGAWQTMDRAVEQVEKQQKELEELKLPKLDELKIPKPKL